MLTIVAMFFPYTLEPFFFVSVKKLLLNYSTDPSYGSLHFQFY
jgi:hypothetical protein